MIDYSKENSDVIELRLYYSFKLLLLYFLKLESMIETDLHAGIVEGGGRPFLFLRGILYFSSIIIIQY